MGVPGGGRPDCGLDIYANPGEGFCEEQRMSTVAKILVVVNLVLAAAFLMAASNYLGQQDTWKKKYTDLDVATQAEITNLGKTINDKEQENVNLLKQVRTAQEDLKVANKENDQVRSMNDLLKQAHNETSGQLTVSANAVDTAQKTIQANREMIDALQAEIGNLRERIRQYLDQKEAAVRSLNEKEIQFENLLANKQDLEARIAELMDDLRSASLTAETAITKLGGEADIPLDQPAHEGRVLAVDGGTNIAVISLGAEDGVKPGFKYMVSRGSQYVTTIVITDVQAKQSAGRSLTDFQKDMIRRGDRVLSR